MPSTAVESKENPTAIWRTAMALSTAAIFLTNATNSDVMLLGIGDSRDIAFLRYSARWYRDTPAFFGNGHLVIRPAFQVGYAKWQGKKDRSQSNTNNVIDLLPVFRWSSDNFLPNAFIDTGLGISIFSAKEMAHEKFGGPLQFNNYLGIGAEFGENKQWEASIHFQHYSNNNIYEENNGANFWHITIGYQY